MIKFLIRLNEYLNRILYSWNNLGLISTFKIFFFHKKKINFIKPIKFPYKIYFRKSGDYGALTHLFNLSYKINDKNSKNKIENIIDLGANIGIETIKFKFFFPDSKIIAVEPEKNNFEILKKNTKNYNSIHLENYAIGNKQTEVYLKNESKNISSNYNESFFVTNESTNRKVKTISIPYLIKKYNLEKINILKSDIEGYERYIFDDSSFEWLNKVDCIIFESPDNDYISKGTTQKIFNAIQKCDLKFNSHICGENIVLINESCSFKLELIKYF
tara:strand:- start:318 stop:1136 length:819 start_codon:yes stop_codon:yes gene_type:complete